MAGIDRRHRASAGPSTGLRHLARQAPAGQARDGPERIFGEWWTRSSEFDAVRDYFVIEDESGERLWIFRSGDGVDAATGSHRWFCHGIFA